MNVVALGQRLCLTGAAIGAIGLLGWITGATGLTTILPGHPPMMPNTALGLVLIGVAGALRRRQQARRLARTLSVLAAIVVLAIGIGTLAEYALHVDLHIDQPLLHSDVGPYPGRASPYTMFALTCLAAALLLFDSRSTARARPSEWLALAAGVAGLVGLVGQLYGAGTIDRFADEKVIGVAIGTAIGLLVTSVGLLLERPGGGIMRIALSPGPGGLLLRRLVLPSSLAPIALGLITLRLATVLGDDEFAVLAAFLTVVAALLAPLLLTITSVPLDRTYQALKTSRAQTQLLIEHASDGIFTADLNGRYTDVNNAG